MDPWWNPAVERQAQDRIHRIGQCKPVRLYFWVVLQYTVCCFGGGRKKKHLVVWQGCKIHNGENSRGKDTNASKEEGRFVWKVSYFKRYASLNFAGFLLSTVWSLYEDIFALLQYVRWLWRGRCTKAGRRRYQVPVRITKSCRWRTW